MADENFAEQPQGSLDEDRIAAIVAEQTARAFDQKFQEYLAQTPPQPQPQASSAQQSDPFAEWLRPQMEPIRREATLAASAASDESRFYRSAAWRNVRDLFDDGETTDDKIEEEVQALESTIEKAFDASLKSNNPVTRDAILKWIIGEKFSRPADKTKLFSTIGRKQAAVERAKVRKAQANVDVGAATLSSLGRDDILGMNDETFEKLWTDVSF